MKSVFCMILLAALTLSVTDARAAGNGEALQKQFSSHFSAFYDFTKERRGMMPISFADENGKITTPASYKGKFVILHFWATWCPPCIKELPTLAAFRARMEGPNLTIVPVSLDYGIAPDKLLDFMKKHKTTGLPMLTVPKSDKAWGTLTSFALPSTFIIDPKGRVLYKMTGDNDWTSPETKAFIAYVIANQKK